MESECAHTMDNETINWQWNANKIFIFFSSIFRKEENEQENKLKTCTKITFESTMQSVNAEFVLIEYSLQ